MSNMNFKGNAPLGYILSRYDLKKGYLNVFYSGKHEETYDLSMVKNISFHEDNVILYSKNTDAIVFINLANVCSMELVP